MTIILALDPGKFKSVSRVPDPQTNTTDATEIPDDCPVLIGRIPFDGLDFVVDPIGGRLIGNPEHGGEQMLDMF